MRQNKGFSLVELMIVVAIIGILAAIAIPNFTKMQLKSKRAEVPGNVDAIKTAEMAYDAAYDAFINAADNPGSVGKSAQAFDTTATDYKRLSWVPDGEVRGSYAVTGASNTDFLVTGRSDVDGDGSEATYTNTLSTNTTLTSGHEDVY